MRGLPIEGAGRPEVLGATGLLARLMILRISMAGRIDSRELGVAPATLLEYLEGERSEIGACSRVFTQMTQCLDAQIP